MIPRAGVFMLPEVWGLRRSGDRLRQRKNRTLSRSGQARSMASAIVSPNSSQPIRPVEHLRYGDIFSRGPHAPGIASTAFSVAGAVQ